MKHIIFPVLLAILLTSCTRYYCQPRPGSKDYAALNLVEKQRTMYGVKHTFVDSTGRKYIKHLTRNDLKVGECYLVDTTRR